MAQLRLAALKLAPRDIARQMQRTLGAIRGRAQRNNIKLGKK
jgi:hypothetical protein